MCITTTSREGGGGEQREKGFPKKTFHYVNKTLDTHKEKKEKEKQHSAFDGPNYFFITTSLLEDEVTQSCL